MHRTTTLLVAVFSIVGLSITGCASHTYEAADDSEASSGADDEVVDGNPSDDIAAPAAAADDPSAATAVVADDDGRVPDSVGEGFSGSSSSSSSSSTAAVEAARRDAVIREGARHLKAPYVFGASTSSTTEFDCSSFVKYLFAKEVGISLPRTAYEQSQSSSLGHAVALSSLEKGDVIFFKTTSRDVPIDHVGIYAGNGRILHTYRVGIGVTYSTFAAGTFWRNHAVLARDFIHH